MTNRKKIGKRKSEGKQKKLRLNKETVKDLATRDPAHVKGGGRDATNSNMWTCAAAAAC